MRKQKVAILGGGMASMTAAFELTNSPELRERYEVTVYQLGWRLGGKCASGRNADYGARVQEHGLHVWFGFYENAFRVMREAYDELGRDPDAPLATWRDAFKPCDEMVLYDGFRDRWRGVSFDVPRNDGIPGDGDGLPDFWQIADEMLRYLLSQWGELKVTNPTVARKLHREPARLPFGMDRLALDVLGRILRRPGHPEDALLAAFALAERRSLRQGAEGEHSEHRSLIWSAIDGFKRWVWEELVEPNVDDDDLRFFFTQFDAGTTLLQGIVEDDLVDRGFDVINDEDLREWMLRHGAQRITVEDGPFVRALYDMAFAYEDGDVARPSMAAGTAVHDMLRLFFTYRGAFAWKMEAGMGDTVFTPFYRVLESRGVKFELFHWVTKLGLSHDRSRIETIDVIPQVRLKHGRYDPFVQVKDLDCWPSEPHWDQIVDGEKLRDRGVNLEWEANPLGHEPETLQWGEDFHHVVLGIPVAALPPICEELIADAGNPGFRAMIENSRTAMTQAFQVWLKRPSDRLGWPFRKNSVMTAYVEPMDTYSDMTHLLPAEAWPADERVAGIGYFCGVLPDHDGDTQERADARARANAIEYLEGDALGIWPDCEGENGGFHWGALVDPDGRRGPDRFDAQFWLANFQATERYVLTPPGNTKYRLAADESGYGNLALAGDWIKTGLDAGCVEAAVMGGMQASRAICGSPEVIVGEDQDWLSDQPASGGHGLPRYVDYGGLATAPSPVDCDDGKLYGFFLDADHARLADLCDRVFAQPSRGRVELFPLGSHVMLTFGSVAKIRPQREPWSRMGFARERQVALWVPVVAIDDSGERPVAASLAWFVPYMWVDNPLSLAGGREIYGFNKNWGEIAMPEDRDGRGLALQAYGGDFDGEREAGWNPLIEVTPRSGDPYGRGRRAWSGVDGLATAVQDVLRRRASEFVAHAGLELPDRVFTDIVRRGGPPQIYLKQFRSIARGDRASSLQITESGVTLKRITGRPLPAEFDVTLHHLDSHPVEAELGIRSQRTRLAFEVEMDFVLDEGTVLWQAPVR